MIIITSIFWVYLPLEKKLKDNMLDQYSYMIDIVDISINQYIKSKIESTKGISSRTMIRQKLSQYLAAEIEFDELVEYTESRYIDGIRAIDHPVCAVRIAGDQIVIKYALCSATDIISTDHFVDYNKNIIEYKFIRNNNDVFFLVKSPIIENDRLLGHDIIAYETDTLSNDISEDNIRLAFYNNEQVDELLSKSDKIITTRNIEVFYIGHQMIHYKNIANTNYSYVVFIDAETLYGPVSSLSYFYLVRFLVSVLGIVFLTNLSIYLTTEKSIEKLEKKKESYKQKYAYDRLTGAISRNYFEDTIKGNIDRNREGLEHVSVAMIDINFFKQINDNEGHDAGDKILITVADFLKKSIRDNDYVVRYGGDEFLLILFNCSEMTALAKVNMIYKMLLDNYDVSIAYGVALVGCGGIKEATRIADGRMYNDKKFKKESVCKTDGICD